MLDVTDTGYNEELDGDAEQAPVSAADNLAEIADYEGNLLDLMEDDAVGKLGAEVVREYQFDDSSRSEWLDSVDRAIKAAKQKPEQKEWPFKKASSIKLPLLTSACIQFGSRAYAALTRGDQPTNCKVIGEDPDGQKTERAQRVAKWNNYSLMYVMDEWDPGTDRLVHTLPAAGSAFRKVFWDPSLARCRADFAQAQDVVVHNKSPSFARAPRQTQPVDYYPHEIDQMIKSGRWANHDYDRETGEDSQSPVRYLEQLRYIDMDGDGLSEPYIVTVQEDREVAVRAEAAFWPNSLMVTEVGGIETILRESPWIDYSFLPDIEGSVYGMGFGQLLESLGSAINSSINQILDAGTRQNTGGGFISDTLRLKGSRGGVMRVNPGEYRMVSAGAQKLADSIHTLQFPGPSNVQFSLVEFLLGLSQDITAVKDVLTGDAPSGQAMGATLALIEQGLEVYSTIYTRIFRSMRRELRLMTRLNERFLSPDAYLRFMDSPKLQQMIQSGYDPMGDFDLTGMDLAPSADPKSVTDMQRMMRSQYLAQFKGQPGINNQEIQRREMQAANIEEIDKLFVQGPDPMQEIQAENLKLENEKLKAEIDKLRSETKLAGNKAEESRLDGETKAFERGVQEGEFGGAGDMAQQPPVEEILPMPGNNAAGAVGELGELNGPVPVAPGVE